MPPFAEEPLLIPLDDLAGEELFTLLDVLLEELPDVLLLAGFDAGAEDALPPASGEGDDVTELDVFGVV